MAYSEYCPVTKLYSLEKFCYSDCICSTHQSWYRQYFVVWLRPIVFTYLQLTVARKHHCFILRTHLWQLIDDGKMHR